MSTLGERILAVRKAQSPKMNQTVFAETLGATRDKINTYENDRVVPTDTFKTLLCQTYHINPRWLDTGEGEMVLQTASDIHEMVERFLGGHSEFARKTIERLLQAPPEVWDRAEAFLALLAPPPDENKDPDR